MEHPIAGARTQHKEYCSEDIEIPGGKLAYFCATNKRKSQKDCVGISIDEVSGKTAAVLADGGGERKDSDLMAHWFVSEALHVFKLGRAGMIWDYKPSARAINSEAASLYKAPFTKKLDGFTVGQTAIMDRHGAVEANLFGDIETAHFQAARERLKIHPSPQLIPQNQAFELFLKESAEIEGMRIPASLDVLWLFLSDNPAAKASRGLRGSEIPRKLLSPECEDWYKRVLNPKDTEKAVINVFAPLKIHIPIGSAYLQLEPGDWFIMCSDGVRIYDNKAEIEKKLKNENLSPEELAQWLNHRGTEIATDNLSGVVIQRSPDATNGFWDELRRWFR